ncbi:hypothetical protein ACU686_44690 [Yinghuangia aomiensis]
MRSRLGCNNERGNPRLRHGGHAAVAAVGSPRTRHQRTRRRPPSQAQNMPSIQNLIALADPLRSRRARS